MPSLDVINDYESLVVYQVIDPISKVNTFRFASNEMRFSEIISRNMLSKTITVYFANEKRLIDNKALKIMYHIQRIKLNLAEPIDSIIYVSNDNDEFVEDYIEYVFKNYDIIAVTGDPIAYKIALLKSMIFYLPSTLDSEDKIAEWKLWNS